MKEIRNIIEVYDRTDFTQRRAVMATVVKVVGSSYRNPGARMLILDNGQWIGSISGGCLEGDAMRKAKQVMHDKKPILVTYDTMDDENNTLGVGLGCNGIIDVLIEPVDVEDNKNPIELIRQLPAFKNLGAMAHVFQSSAEGVAQVCDRLLLKPNGTLDKVCTTDFVDLIKSDLNKTLERKSSSIQSYDLSSGKIDVLFEVVEPTVELLIFGGGFDAKPVTEIAKTIGWRVTVTDECVAHIAPRNFPMADEIVMCQREYVSRDIEVSPYTAIVLMSHNYHYDLEVLKQVLTTPAPYIGILGPRKRTDKLFNELAKVKIELTDFDLQRIHTPIGLDIGAETPEEIAMAILTEILAKFSGRSGGFLKYHRGPIHRREGISEEVFKQVYLNSSDDIQQSS